DRRTAGGARMHLAGYFLKAEMPALQNHQRFDLRIFQWKALAEYLQRFPVDAYKSGGGVVHRLSQNGAQHHTEEADAEPPQGARLRPITSHKTRPDHHLAAGTSKRFKDAWNVAGVVLAVAIHTDDVLVTELEGELVPSLNATAEP